MSIIETNEWILEDHGKPVSVGQSITDFRGEKTVAIGGIPPRNDASTGRVIVPHGASFYPGVFGLKWVRK